MYGVVIAPQFAATLAASWDLVIGGNEKVLRDWATRHLPTLRQRAAAVETFAVAKAWYLAQILPLPSAAAARLRRAIIDFLWNGCLEWLAHEELHIPFSEGGLRLSSIPSRAQALLAKQACHRLAAGGRPARHLAYWIGLRLRPYLPALGSGLHAEDIPPVYKDLSNLLIEVFGLPSVSVNSLADVSSKGLYMEFTSTLPRPKVEDRLPDLPWRIAWLRMAYPSLPALAANVVFSLLHNVLPLQARRHRLRLAPSPHCPHCPNVTEDVLHFFTACPRVATAWALLSFRVALLVGGTVPDRLLLFFAWPAGGLDLSIAAAVAAYAELAWSTRDDTGPLLPALVHARVDAAAACGTAKSIFCL